MKRGTYARLQGQNLPEKPVMIPPRGLLRDGGRPLLNPVLKSLFPVLRS